MTVAIANIFRSAPRVGYTPLPNRVANDERLSARALGVLYYILSKPPGWCVIPEQLAARFGMSYRTALAILSELRSADYVRRDLLRDEQQRIVGVRYLVSDEPGWFGDLADDENPNEKPSVGFAACGSNRQTENRHAVERNESNKLNSCPANAEPKAGLQEGSNGQHRTSHAIGADRGAIEMQIATRIGFDGFDVLMALPASQVDQLCARQRRGTLDERTIEKLRLDHHHLGRAG